ncbi:MAG: ERCC4 domain-containing protein [Elusimicrobiota bacterium]
MQNKVVTKDIEIKIDLRENKSKICDILANKYSIQIDKVMLPVGDYIIGNEIVVERKTAVDFVQSIIDGRLFQQAQKIGQLFDRALFIIEGENLYNTGIDIHPHAISGAIVSIAVKWCIPILFTKDTEETALLLWLIATQHHEIKKELTYRHGYRPKTYRKRQLYILQGLPNVGPKLANNLLNYFGSVEKVFTATKEELTKVDNLGKKKAEKICMLLREERTKYCKF